MSVASHAFEQRLKVWMRRISAILGFFIFAAAVYFIRRITKQYTFEQITQSIESIPRIRVLWALLATLASYSVLALYDLLALHYIRKRLRAVKTVFTSIVAFSLSYNTGMANLAGNSVRLRLYSHFGLRPSEILAIVVFISFSFWTGFLGLAGAVFLFAPPRIPDTVHHLTLGWLRVFGAVLFALPIGYYLTCRFRWTPKFMKRLHLELPSPSVSALQIVVSAAEWSLAALALYVLLPSSAAGTFVSFLSVFATAQFLGLISHVPGGIGVLEATVLFFVSKDEAPSAAALGALLAFRIIYYFSPMILSLVALLIYEIDRKIRRSLNS